MRTIWLIWQKQYLSTWSDCKKAFIKLFGYITIILYSNSFQVTLYVEYYHHSIPYLTSLLIKGECLTWHWQVVPIVCISCKLICRYGRKNDNNYMHLDFYLNTTGKPHVMIFYISTFLDFIPHVANKHNTIHINIYVRSSIIFYALFPFRLY